LMMFAIGVFAMGYGMGIYISAQMGAGPRDSFMLAVMQKTGWKVSHIRRSMELVVLLIGWWLGGPVHLGTIIFSLIIGTVSGYALPQCQAFTDFLIKKINVNKEETDRGVNI
ncbi:MAG TPA: hypothetical protein VEY51_12055, partial [Chondromyces sp.]|nr:hypothetical protein [Chondromyces sp.]